MTCFLLAPLASATDVLPGSDICGQAGTSAVCADKSSAEAEQHPIRDIIHTVTEIIAAVAGIVAVIMIIISGLRFISSGGESQQVAGARNNLLYAIIGLVVIALASTIITFVISRV
ncbi:MAG: pilin [Candidatus Saccharimonadales bacterium]